jgi:hypothetical protein
MKGTFQTVYYLQKLGLEHFDLILEFATWVLQTNPDEGMEVSLIYILLSFFLKKKITKK